jgi:hypothetical protein
VRYLVLLLTLTTGLSAADFTFGTMLRAGLVLPLLPVGDWEMTTGSTATDTSQPKVDASPYYSNGGWQAFEIGYDGLAGFFRLYDGAAATGHFITSSFAATAPPGANATWTLNSYLQATGNIFLLAKAYSAVGLTNLALGAGLTVLTPLASTSYTAHQAGLQSTMRTDLPPVTFRSNNADGSWVLTGQVRFVGLANYTLTGASGSQLEFGLTASSAESAIPTPEPETWLLCAGALAFGSYRRRQYSGARLGSEWQ